LITKLKFVLSIVALLGCLMAAAEVHAHETGLHDVEHTCLSCDFEDVVSHGVAVSFTPPLKLSAHEQSEYLYYSSYFDFNGYKYRIRAPPHIS